MDTGHLNRRQWLATLGAAGAAGALIGGPVAAAPAKTDTADAADAADAAQAVQRLAASWRGPRDGDPLFLGALDLDWRRGVVAVAWSQPLPSRAHGLTALPDGGVLAVAMRPGRWLLRCDAHGRVVQRLAMDDEPDGHTLDGHAITSAPSAPSADGAWIYTTQTDAQGRGWLAVRDSRSLRTVDRWSTLGIDPHQLLLDAEGDVVLVNGGIARTARGHKHQLDQMASSLVQLDQRDGRPRGRWTLDDPRLSLRHLAWARPADDSRPLLGVALQAEHDDPRDRAAAPVLALWDGQILQPSPPSVDARGYAGDISAAGPGGFAVSAQHADRGLVWWPGLAHGVQPFARIAQPCALAAPTQGPDRGAVLLAGAAGVARWHPSQAPAMLRWPVPMVLDNHWIELSAAREPPQITRQPTQPAAQAPDRPDARRPRATP
jgi:uncharacterized protein